MNSLKNLHMLSFQDKTLLISTESSQTYILSSFYRGGMEMFHIIEENNINKICLSGDLNRDNILPVKEDILKSIIEPEPALK